MSWIDEVNFIEPMYDYGPDGRLTCNWLIEDWFGEFYKVCDDIRKGFGYTDLAEDPDTEVYYSAYLYYTEFPDGQSCVWVDFTCNHGEKDDYHEYDVELTKEEESKLLQIAKDLIRDASEENPEFFIDLENDM